MVLAKINPNAELIAAIRFEKEQQKLTLINSNALAEQTLLDVTQYAKNKGSIKQLIWIDNQNIAVQFVEVKKGLEDLLDTKLASRLLIINIPIKQPLKVKIYSVRTRGWLVDPLIKEPNFFYYAKSGLYSRVYKIDVRKLLLDKAKINKLTKIDGGQFKKTNQIIDVKGFAKRWFITSSGEVKAVLHFTKVSTLTLSSLNKEGEASLLTEWSLNDIEYNAKNNNTDKEEKKDDDKIDKKLIPIALSPKENSFYCLDLNEEQQQTVYQVDFANGKEEIVYQASAFKIIDIIQNKESLALIGVKVVNNAIIESVFLNDSSINKPHKNEQTSVLVSKINESKNKQTAIIYQESYNNSGQFFIQNKVKNRQLIGERYPQLTHKLTSKMVKGTVIVKGLSIPYLLTLPSADSSSRALAKALNTPLDKSSQQLSDNQKKYPLIVMPHGGPIGIYDTEYFDAITQLLNHHNYAVLRVNYRGSSGFNADFKNAGKKQWGQLMLEDIYQATLAVTKRNDINRDEICSFGMSYGGYAALMLTIKHPNLYQCAASWAGVTDINLYLNSIRFGLKQQKWLKEFIGDSETDYQRFKEQSPVFLANEITTPILIAHGRKDKMVDIEHAYRLKLMMDKYKKPYQWFIDDKATHSFGSLEQRADFFTRLLTFLEKHINSKDQVL